MWMTPSSRCLYFMSCGISPWKSDGHPTSFPCKWSACSPPNSFHVFSSSAETGLHPHDRHVEPPLSPILSCSRPSVHQDQVLYESSPCVPPCTPLSPWFTSLLSFLCLLPFAGGWSECLLPQGLQEPCSNDVNPTTSLLLTSLQWFPLHLGHPRPCPSCAHCLS